jgi:hypothetical protein
MAGKYTDIYLHLLRQEMSAAFIAQRHTYTVFKIISVKHIHINTDHLNSAN